MTKREYAVMCEQLVQELMVKNNYILQLKAKIRRLKEKASQNAEESAKNTIIILELCNDDKNRERIVEGDINVFR